MRVESPIGTHPKADVKPSPEPVIALTGHIIIDFRTTTQATPQGQEQTRHRLVGVFLKHSQAERSVEINGHRLKLTKTQNRLLTVLTNNPSVGVPVATLKRRAWPGKLVSDGAFRMGISNLRKKLGDNHKVIIQEKARAGYRFGDLDPTKVYDSSRDEVVNAQVVVMLGGKITYYPENCAVVIDERVVELTEREADLLAVLNNHANETVSSNDLYREVWPNGSVSKNMLEVTIKRLREKIEPDPEKPIFVHTERKAGYRFGELDKEKAQKIELLDGTVVFFRNNNRIIANGVATFLGNKEHDLLLALHAHMGELVPQSSLMQDLWPDEPANIDNLRNLCKTLRKKIEPDPKHPILIHTIWGRGYMLDDLNELRIADNARMEPTTV